MNNPERQHDAELMKEDLKFLLQYEDEYILSSLSTNEYLIQSEESQAEKFKEVCETLMEEASK